MNVVSACALPVPLMVDSGADDSFIDETLAREAGLPLIQLSEPCTDQDLNGRTLARARATHCTASLTLLVSGNHRKKMHLFLIPSSASPAVLGFPWLATHNPPIDWASGTITAWSVNGIFIFIKYCYIFSTSLRTTSPDQSTRPWRATSTSRWPRG